MTRVLITMTILAVTAVAFAGEDCCPAPAAKPVAHDCDMPAGECDMHTNPAASQQTDNVRLIRAQQQELPEGHPPLQGQQRQMPEGHPPIDGGRQQALPDGHPPLPGATSQPATSQPAGASLVIRGVQGTEGGPAVAGSPVTVTLYKRSGPYRTIETQLDEHGVVMIEDLEVTETIQPQVHVEHQGVRYEVVGDFLTPQKPAAQVDVTVNETTHDKPDWSIAMRHIIVSRDGGSYHVKDVFTLDNPSDRTYVGPEKTEGETIDPTTVAVPIPTGARDVTWTRSFDECCTQLKNGVVVNHAPIRAGRTRYQINYRLPIADGQAVIDLVAPRSTDALMIFLPDDQTQVATDDFESLGTFDMGSHQPMRTFKRADVEQGAKSVLTLSADTTQARAPAAKTSGGNTPKMLAGIGVLGAVIAGLLIMFIKKPQPKKG